MLINIVHTMMKTASMMMICILVTMLTALIWYGFLNKITKIEQAEVLVLLDK